MVIGVLRPRLLLPEEGYDARSLAFILRHELTHCRRHDLWYQLALLLANAVHWFNPLIWLMVRQAQGDMELTCDDAVVAGADRESPPGLQRDAAGGAPQAAPRRPLHPLLRRERR